jgi:hypothetical protein
MLFSVRSLLCMETNTLTLALAHLLPKNIRKPGNRTVLQSIEKYLNFVIDFSYFFLFPLYVYWWPILFVTCHFLINL